MVKHIKYINTIIAVFFITVCLPVTGRAEYNRRDAIVSAVEKVSTAVVNVSSEYEIHRQSHPFSGFGMNPFFDSFFKGLNVKYLDDFMTNNPEQFLFPRGS